MRSPCVSPLFPPKQMKSLYTVVVLAQAISVAFVPNFSEMPPHPAWESPVAEEQRDPGSPACPWDDSDYDNNFEASDSDKEEDTNSPEWAGKQMLELLMDLYLLSNLSAKAVCEICYFAALAGAKGDFDLYGVKPGSSSGNYQKHLNDLLGFKQAKREHYNLTVAGHPRFSPGRARMRLPVRAPHELLEAELEKEPDLVSRCEAAVANQTLPRAYYTSPVVQQADTPVIPCSLYMDGVQYSNTDTVVGMFLVNVLTGARYLIGVVRKSTTCSCGCRGWDTFFPIMAFLRWSFECLAAGRWPTARHDKQQWAPEDGARANKAGKPLRAKAMLLHCRGDWAEFCERFGFFSSSSGLRPCFCCSAAEDDALFSPAGVSLAGAPWRTTTDEDFDRAAASCEQSVLVDSAAHTALKALLKYDQRSGGSCGLSLRSDYEPLGLIAGDRVEPTEDMPDVAEFFVLSVFPVRVLFWRVARETLLRHRCPLWSPGLGITPTRVVAIDLLHTFYLGPLNLWAKEAIWALLDAHIWATPGHTETEKVLNGLRTIQHHLSRFYKKYDQEHRDDTLSRVSRLSPKMVGFGAKRKLKAKAKETHGIAMFLVEFLPLFLNQLGCRGQQILDAGTILLTFLRTMKNSSDRISVQEQQTLLDMYKKYLHLASTLGLTSPKTHLMLHLILRAFEQGNPVKYQTFIDEALNSTLKRSLARCHQANFENMALCKVGEILARPVVRQRLF